MVILTGAVYSQCDASNWQEYYNSAGTDMTGCNLIGANLSGAILRWADLTEANLERANFRGATLQKANLTGAILEEIYSSDIIGTPEYLPEGWSLVGGTLINQENKSPYSNIPQEHINSDNRIRYEIMLGLKSDSNHYYERNDFFYDTSGDKTVIFDSWLEYGFMNGIYPCSPNCNTKLYAHAENGVIPIKNPKLIVDSQDVCGEMSPLIWVEHEKIKENVLFISTMQGTKENSYMSAINLKVEKWPDYVHEDSLLIPIGFKDKKVTLYKYGENDAFIAEVQATGWFESGDWDRDGPSRQENWTGIYYVDKRGVKVLTPVDFQTQWYYGKDFSFRGIEDINGDGELDLIIGNNSSVFYDYNTVTLILERYKDGFRSWGFGIFPSGGC